MPSFQSLHSNTSMLQVAVQGLRHICKPTPKVYSACLSTEGQLAVHPSGLSQARVHNVAQRVDCRQQVLRRPHNDAAVVLCRREAAEAVACVVIVHRLARFVPQSALDLCGLNATFSKQ